MKALLYCVKRANGLKTGNCQSLENAKKTAESQPSAGRIVGQQLIPKRLASIQVSVQMAQIYKHYSLLLESKTFALQYLLSKRALST